MKPNDARGDAAKQLRFDIAFAEKTLLKRGHLGVMFVVHTKDKKHIIATPWQDDDEKAAYLEMVRAYCIAHDAEALSYIGEAWARYMEQAPNETAAEFDSRVHAVRPRDAEDRREVVMVIILFRDDAGQRQMMSESREIERRANGKPSGLKMMRSNNGWDVLHGPIVDAFPEWPPTAADRFVAQLFLDSSGVGDGHLG